MQRVVRVLTAALSGLIFGTLAISNCAVAQTANDLVGTWALVSATSVKDGSKTDLFGANPKGLYVFTSDGRFAIMNMRAELPKFASNNRMQGTAEENKEIVQGSIALFGTYTVADKVLTMKVEGSTWPTWTGTEQKRNFTLAGDEMKWTLAATVGGTAEIVVQRLK